MSPPKAPDSEVGADVEVLKLGLFALLRRLERQNPHKPRIGRNDRLSEEIVTIGQDPSLDFAVSDLSGFRTGAEGRHHVRSNVLGFFGPQGALPLNTTEEVLRWSTVGDRSFVGFADIFAARFLQLFFRGWSDSHAISQFDHPAKDRFQYYVGALGGVGTAAFRARDSISDVRRTYLVSLHASRVKSAVRLRQLIETHLGASVTVREHQSSWIDFEPGDQNRLGQRGSSLGRSLFLGARMRSVNERITLDIRAKSLADYRRYLPGGDGHAQLADLVFWFLGKVTDVTITLALPASEIPPAQLGKTTELGWMAALAPAPPDPKATAPQFVQVANFSLMAA